MYSKFLKTIILLICTHIMVVAQDYLIPKDELFWNIVPKDTKVEKAASGFKFTEGPVWNKKSNYLLFSDIPANTIIQLSQEGKLEVFKNPSGNSNGLTYDPQGRLVICSHADRNILRIEKDGKLTVLASLYKGKKFNSPNDIVFKPSDGTFFFTDPPYGLLDSKKMNEKELSFSGVYRVKDGVVTLIDSSLQRPNGIALSPDEKFLYVAQSEFKWLWKVYELDKNSNVVSDKIFYEGSEITGNPDGVKVDVLGNVYCTGNNGVVIFTNEGKLLGTIKVPENTANLAWGDPDLKTLYFTAQGSIYKVRLKIAGYLGY